MTITSDELEVEEEVEAGEEQARRQLVWVRPGLWVVHGIVLILGVGRTGRASSTPAVECCPGAVLGDLAAGGGRGA